MEIDISTIILIMVFIVAGLYVLVKLFYEKEEEEPEDKEQKTLEDFPAVAKSWVEPMTENHKEFLATKGDDVDYAFTTETDSLFDKKSYDNDPINDEEKFTMDNNDYEEEQEDDFITEDNHVEENLSFDNDDFEEEQEKDFITVDNQIEENISFDNDDNEKEEQKEDFITEENHDEENLTTENMNDKKDFTTWEKDREKDLSTEKTNKQIPIATNLSKKQGLNALPLYRKIKNKKGKVVEIKIGDRIYDLTEKDTVIFSHNNENYSSYVLDIKHGNVKVKYRSQEKWIKFSQIKKIL